uniref:Cellular communication network factor 6 n=1 Tax=Callorhinchus milii TaxID=7868 RepID=A0A4W3HAT1_CALMI
IIIIIHLISSFLRYTVKWIDCVFCGIQESKAQQGDVKTRTKTAEFEDPPERRQFCKWPCKCSNKPICSAGASLVTDGCGCCKACAKQVGELCTEADTCDPHKDLYCDYSRDRPRYEFGVCAYTIGVACELNEAFYHHGQTFQPNCYYKCTCLNGAIGCTPTCTKKLAAGQCRNPKNVKRSGYCCEKSFCDKQVTFTNPNHQARPVVWRKTCPAQTTLWSPCSKSCGMGISVRASNDNSQCEFRRENRLCFIRPCDTGKKCQQTFRPTKPEKFAFSGCTSIKSYRPTYCGACMDARCCVPNKSKTGRIQFNCTDGGKATWKMTWIISCECGHNCTNPEDPFTELRLL